MIGWLALEDRTFVRILQDNQGKYKHLGNLDTTKFSEKEGVTSRFRRKTAGWPLLHPRPTFTNSVFKLD
jgi:hypothetical protein